MWFGRERGMHVRAAWVHGCMCATSARCAPAAADGARCHVERAHLARHDGRVSIGLGRRDVREHRRHAGEPRHQRCVWYLYTIESAPFMVRTVTLSGLRCPNRPHRLYSHSTSFGHMTTMLNTFILVCSDVLENQISLRKIKISCNLVHPGGKKTVLQWPCAPCGAMFEY